MHEAALYSFLLRLGASSWLKILQCFGKSQPWESKRRCPADLDFLVYLPVGLWYNKQTHHIKGEYYGLFGF
jgi:hypothetical protein